MTKQQNPDTPIRKLRILATSDVHMHMFSFNYFLDAAVPDVGLEGLIAKIAELREAAASDHPPRAVLLVDNGDVLQGTAPADHLADQPDDKKTHPLASVMNALGYDAVGLGNHDFDYGLDYLKGFACDLDAHVISSNFHAPRIETWLDQHVCLTCGDLRVGLLSVVPPGSIEGLRGRLGDAAKASDMMAAARRSVTALREQGCDVVIALAHTGIGNGVPDNVLDQMARHLPLDALVGGHTHRVFPGPDHADHPDADMENGTLCGVPTVMPGFAGGYLGCIDLDLAPRDAGWQVIRHSATVLPSAPVNGPPAPELAPMRAIHDDTRISLDQPFSDTEIPLHSFFAQVQSGAVQAVVAASKHAVIFDARASTPWADLPLLSAVTLSRVGGSGGSLNYTNIPAGPLRNRHVSEINGYSNHIWAVEVTGVGLREWLEKSASSFARVGGDPHVGLWDTRYPAFDFDVIFGLHYEINPMRPARYDRAGDLRYPDARRIFALTHDGNPVRDTDRFLVAVNSYRACGGGKFPGLTPSVVALRTDIGTAAALKTQLRAPMPNFDPPWRFSEACEGVQTWFETGAGAADHLADIAYLSPAMPQPQHSGFVRIPITLAPCKPAP